MHSVEFSEYSSIPIFVTATQSTHQLTLNNICLIWTIPFVKTEPVAKIKITRLFGGFMIIEQTLNFASATFFIDKNNRRPSGDHFICRASVHLHWSAAMRAARGRFMERRCDVTKCHRKPLPFIHCENGWQNKMWPAPLLGGF